MRKMLPEYIKNAKNMTFIGVYVYSYEYSLKLFKYYLYIQKLSQKKANFTENNTD